eukprot:8369011-Lingulodinium_polyedra.AAC.1
MLHHPWMSACRVGRGWGWVFRCSSSSTAGGAAVVRRQPAGPFGRCGHGGYGGVCRGLGSHAS